jgi:ATP-binding cassette subfamily B (MDR/TAP) protein 1
MTVVLGSSASLFVNAANGAPASIFQDGIHQRALDFVYIAIGSMATTYISTSCWSLSGENISLSVRKNYLRSLMRQSNDVSDDFGAGEVASRLTTDMDTIQDGISEKVGLSLMSISTCCTSLVIAFTRFWKLALIVSCLLPITAFVTGFLSKLIATYTKRSLNSRSDASNFAADVLVFPHVAQMFGIEEKLVERYRTYLARCRPFALRTFAALGTISGAVFFLRFCAYGLAFWEGSRLSVSTSLDVGIVVNVLFSIIIATFALGQSLRYFPAFSAANTAATSVFRTIDRIPKIDVYDKTGLQLDHLIGGVRLQNIKFAYPSRPENLVLDGLDLDFASDSVTAIVGPSGSGKSTISDLIWRAYDVLEGQILIDGHIICDLNLASLRSKIAIVPQEPELFSTTIYNNIAYGLAGTPNETASADVKDRLIRTAAAKACLTDWIQMLPEGYNTIVGKKGLFLSGGQRQRVAIARAIVRDPRILILDEATSSLDVVSEALVQEALRNLTHGRTTIVIAHRLSTIKTADKIAVLFGGKITEQGTHQQLMDLGGLYNSYIQSQTLSGPTRKSVLPDTSSPGLGKLSRESAPTISHGLKHQEEKTMTFHAEPQTARNIISLMLEMMRLNDSEYLQLVLGYLASIGCGVIYPAQSYVFAKFILLFATPQEVHFRQEANVLALSFVIIAFGLFFTYFGSIFLLKSACDTMTERIRAKLLRIFLGQDKAWFDSEEHSYSNLISALGHQAEDMALLHGSTLGILLSTATNIVSTCVISIAFSWRLGLVTSCVFPIIMLAGYLQSNMMRVLREQSKERHKTSAKNASEATSLIRTIALLTMERRIVKTYSDELDEISRTNRGPILRASMLLGFSRSLTYFVNAFTIWYGSVLIVKHEVTALQFFICFIGVTFGAQDAGDALSYAPDLSRAASSTSAILDLLSVPVPQQDKTSFKGLGLFDGYWSLVFKDVHFRYPRRPHVPVLNGIEFTLTPGRHIAIVGPSGGGKSTIMHLLARFYNPSSGYLSINGNRLDNSDLVDYRSSISLVSQEPCIYPGTILFNIMIGASGDVSNEELESACQKADILEFIISLPMGFETICGPNGIGLSGGQKQRITIARALIRKPQILLLDEATSALDSQSEAAIRRVIEDSSKRMAIVSVAHRLSTIQQADLICFVDRGKIIEQGNHAYLLNLGGHYAALVAQQAEATNV